MARETFTSIETTAAQAESLVATGHFAEAERRYRELIGQTHVIDIEYDDWLRRLAEIYKELGRKRDAGFIHLYLHYFDNARDAFAVPELKAERALVLEIEKRWMDAAELYSEAGLPIHAAVAYDKAENFEVAARAWERVARELAVRDRPYEAALIHFNYGMAVGRSSDSAAGKTTSLRALIDSQRRLEQVADDFEVRGERERAFDCYQILLKLGKESGQFENLAEGYINCIRVLKHDNLKFYVLQYYEDFIDLALERKELHAAATLFQEAADYSAHSGLPYDRHYQKRAGETWAACADRYRGDEAPVEMTENALLAAIACQSSVGNYVAVYELFVKLSELDLPQAKTERYRKISAKYSTASVDGREMPSFPEYLKQQHAYADIWFVDLLEWELGGDPYRVAISIVGDLRYPDGIRRRALVVILTLADAATRGEERSPETLAQVASLLGELQVYAALNPLEKLFEHTEPEVRRAAVRALRFLFFKRSFVLIRRALRDQDSGVRDAAVDALRGLHFPHAFNPLARIYRESDEQQVKVVALESIGKIQSIEAGEMLLSVLRHEDSALREVAKRALAAFDNADVLPILRQYYQIEANPEVRAALEDLLRSSD